MKEYLNAWTPVKLEKKDNFIKADVWGRSYEFDNSPFPTQIISKGQELLYAPITLTPVFGDKIGKWDENTSTVFSQEDEKATFITSAVSHNTILDTAVNVEYDGFVKIDLKVMSFWGFRSAEDSVPQLTGLYLDVPVKKEYASLMHYWPNDKQSIIPAGKILNSGKTQDMTFPFKPYISLGNNEVGLGVFAGETTENIVLNDEDKCITITDEGEYVNIRIRFLEQIPENWHGRKDRWVSALKPMTYTVGFHATPVKEMRTTDDTYKIAHVGRCADIADNGKVNQALIDELKSYDIKWIILHEDWTAIQNYGFPADKDLTKGFIDACHEKGMRVMVYFGYEYSTLAPGWNKNAENYLIKTIDGEFTGGWQRLPHQRAFMVCYNGGYSDEMISRVEYVMDELGVDGIYTDGTYVPWECANEAHGCGYTDAKGVRHTTFPVLAVREHVKKLYEAVHKRGGIIDTHQSSCCLMPTLSFCDSYYDGENIQGNLTKDTMDFLNMDAFRAEYMGYNYGLPVNFIAYTNEERPMETLSALTILHNVHCRPGCLHGSLNDIKYLSKIWNIFDEYSLNKSTWHPYWKNELVTAEGGAYASCYETDKGIVAAVSDFTCGIDSITLNIPKNCKAVTNLLTNEKFTGDNGKVTIASDYSTLNLLLIEEDF